MYRRAVLTMCLRIQEPGTHAVLPVWGGPTLPRARCLQPFYRPLTATLAQDRRMRAVSGDSEDRREFRERDSAPPHPPEPSDKVGPVVQGLAGPARIHSVTG